MGEFQRYIPLATCGIALASLFGARQYRASQTLALQEHFVVELEQLNSAINEERFRDLTIPAELSLPKEIADEPRVAALFGKYALLAKSTNAAFREPVLANVHEASLGGVNVNRVLLQEVMNAHPTLISAPKEWELEMLSRIDLIKSQQLQCPCVPFGLDADNNVTAELSDSLTRLTRASETDERLAQGADLLSAIEVLERSHAATRPMPVINGDARGALPPVGTLVRFCEKVLPLPATQTFFEALPERGGASFKLVTRGGGSNVYARLLRNGSDAWKGFVRAGEVVTVDLPPGSYTLRYADGKDWYGHSYLFGPRTSFSEAGEPIVLERGYAMTIELIPQRDGNLEEKKLDPNNF